MIEIKRALVSVSDKSGLIELAKGLKRHGVEIISTGGTAKTLHEAGVETITISQVTDFPEMLDGRVKTLHPAIHGGLLARRDKDSHMKALKEMDITPIDMVVVNLYPFAQTIAKPGTTLEEAIEQIDIGGPSMIRSASKNNASVVVVTDPQDYDEIMKELDDNKGSVSQGLSYALACKAFAATASYDAMISSYLSKGTERLPDSMNLAFKKKADLRYGENPHQSAGLYIREGNPEDALTNARQLHGKEMSYNNWLDLQAAWQGAQGWDMPAICIIKHNNPCGIAAHQELHNAYSRALESDPVSAFGGIIGSNTEIDERTASKISELFVEAIIAPGYSEEAFKSLSKKKDLRILQLMNRERSEELSYRFIDGGVLVQDSDWASEEVASYRVVTAKKPTESEWRDLVFAWNCARNVKSNAIVLVKDMATVGVGAGQMSRVDSSYIAIRKAGERASGSVASSDAFFPFPDGIEVLAEAGISGIIQPGGSIKDDEVIAAADRLGIFMVFTGIRHFAH